MRIKHYDETRWTAYLKGRFSEAVAAEMQQHLAVCNECQMRAELCRAVIAGGSDEPNENPPAEWVREGVLLYDPKLLNETPGSIFAILKSDSYLEGPSGLRSRRLEERQLTFESAGFEIDVLMEISTRSLRGVAGQLILKNLVEPRETVMRVPTELRVGEELHEAETTEFGEFMFRLNDLLTEDPVELRFRFKDDRPCLVLLIPC